LILNLNILKRIFTQISFAGVSIILLIALAWWTYSKPKVNVVLSEPGMDNRESKAGILDETINIGEFFESFFSSSNPLNETWPRFRGSDFDNIKKGGVDLIDKFESGNPKIKWKAELGEGHAGPSVYKGLVYVMDYDEQKKADMLRCFALQDGREVWRRWYNVNIKRNHGMSRTIPAVTEKYILTIGPRSHVMCLERESGELLWGLDIEKEYDTQIPFWYTGQCPLIDDGKAIIATGGNALVIAIDCETGEKLWELPNDHGLKMSHASIMPWYYGGRNMYVYSAVGGVVGIAADGEDAGSILWQSLKWGCSVVAPSPVCLPDGKVFLTAGYGAGSMVFQVKEESGTFSIEKLYEYKPKDGLACEQQTPVVYDGLVYGIVPKDGGALRNQLVCVSPADFRQVIWSSGKTNRFGLGPYMIADDKFWILNDDGMLSIVQPGKTAFKLMDQIKVFEAHDAWAPLAIADGYLLLRDDHTMICMDIRK
jgi:outer membrane protein assembly factor BamB